MKVKLNEYIVTEEEPTFDHELYILKEEVDKIDPVNNQIIIRYDIINPRTNYRKYKGISEKKLKRMYRLHRYRNISVNDHGDEIKFRDGKYFRRARYEDIEDEVFRAVNGNIVKAFELADSLQVLYSEEVLEKLANTIALLNTMSARYKTETTDKSYSAISSSLDISIDSLSSIMRRARLRLEP